MRFQKATTFLTSHFPRQIFNRLKGEIYNNNISVLYYPFNLSIDLTTACNMRCPFCSTEKYREKSTSLHLSFSEGKKLLEKFNKASFVSFCGAGEPFLNPDLFALVRYANQLKMKVYVTTNGMLLNKRLEELLASNVDELEISLKGISGADYTQFTGRKKTEFYTIIASVKRLSKSQSRPKLLISYVCDRKKVCNIPKVIEIAKYSEADELVFYNLIPDETSRNEEYCLYEDDKKWVWEILDSSWRESPKMVIKGPEFYSRDSNQRNCHLPMKSLRIGVDGGVSGCSRAICPSLENGNAFIDNKVFNSDHFKKLRYEHINKNIPLRYECFYCDLRL